eukprot:SAG11_NODE_193_length_12862_cov_7.128888_15_plen_78_part_00
MATSLKYNTTDDPDASLWDQQKWKLLSAGANLLLIVVAGIVYELIAEKLNNFENYRTETEYQDGLIAKNFLFQFVNN